MELARQAERAIPWLVVAFGAGIALFFTWKTDPVAWLPAVPVALGAGLTFTRARAVGLALIAIGLGHGAAQVRTAMVATPLLERETRRVEISGRVTSAEARPDSNRIVMAPRAIPGVAPAMTPERLRITIPAGHGLPAVGDIVTLPAVVGPAKPPVVPDGFQFQRFLYFAGIGGTGYTIGRWRSEPHSESSFRATTEAWRRAIGARIEKIVPGPDGAVVKALVNGEQNAIPQDLQEAYRAAGIVHLLSISGLHMTLLAGAVFFMVRRLLALAPAIALRTDTKKVAAWAGLAATGFYLLISGMSVPAIRSFVMIAVVMLAILLDRTALSLRTIAWAALLLMVLFPEAVVGASFQMSFLAVLALVSLYEQTWLRIIWRGDDGRLTLVRAAGIYLAGLVVTDIAAGGATSLFAAYHFNVLPTYSMITNLLTVPLTGLWIMPAMMLGLILMPLGLEEIPFRVMGAGVHVLNDIARTVAAWPNAQVQVPSMAAWAMALGALGAIFICLWKGRGRWLGFIALIPAVVQPYLTPPPDVLVDDTARVFAVSDADGHMAAKPGRAGGFIKEVWADRYGASERSWPDIDGLSCDADGCVLARNDRKMLMAFTSAALAEDCGNADLIVSTTAARDLCREGKIIDLIDLRRDGAHALWLTNDGVRVRAVKDSTGNRVWMRGLARDGDEDSERTD
ncbi:MAG: ComEC family competence protein [Rhodospirillaceae bacterium]|nr:ComEC family competence protein [Rhodospirillaceae bacterium]